MTSLWLLGLNDANTRVEERILEWLLPRWPASSSSAASRAR